MLIFDGRLKSADLSHVIDEIETVDWYTIKYKLLCKSSAEYNSRFLPREELLILGTQATKLEIKTYCPGCDKFVICKDPEYVLVRFVNEEILRLHDQMYKKVGLENYVV